MDTRDDFGVIMLRPGLPYADGAEQRALEDLLSVVDRSDGSDELAERIVDWPTRYHYDPARSNLLRPLRLPPCSRALDVGCGTGALTRWLGEQGVEVTGLEGNLDRARSAAVRCEDLGRVRVVCGRLEDLGPDDIFDTVIVVGVLEYSPVFLGPGGPRQLLAAARRQLRPGGTLVLAIENQLGLKYLLGYAEDHRAQPWVGVEGYRQANGPRTWSRAVLSGLLRDSGFPDQRWLFPYPDYKLPTVIVDEALFARPGGWQVVDQLVRVPVTSDASAPSLLCDARAAHRELLAAGLGPEVANSFLVLASDQPQPAVAPAEDELAWLFGAGRRRQWRRHRAIVQTGTGLTVRDHSDPAAVRSLAWLRQHPSHGGERPYTAGEPLDLLLTAALRAHDLPRASDVLKSWRQNIDSRAVADPDPAAGLPFAPAHSSEPALPGELLDVLPANFVAGPDGGLSYIDGEWETGHHLSARLVQVRALWWTAHELVATGEPHPWGSLATVDEVCQSLCELALLGCSALTLARVKEAEVSLQSLVHGRDSQGIAEDLDRIGRRRTLDQAPRQLDYTTLRAALGAARAEVDQLGGQLRERDEQLDQACFKIAASEVEAVAAEARADLRDAGLLGLEQRLAEEITRAEAAERSAAELRQQLDAAVADSDGLRQLLANIERRLAVRLSRALRRATGR